MAHSLLADLVTMIAKSPEDVATRALELILQRSSAARAATGRLLGTWAGRDTEPATRWASQEGGSDKSRTDLQGFDASENTVAIFENKFWAGLTDHQPNTYLKRLESSAGILVFLVPTTRVPLISLELALRLGTSNTEQVCFQRQGHCDVLQLNSGCTVVVASWSVLLATIASSLEAAQEYELRADLHQLEGLVQKMDVEGFRPLTPSDVTGDAPRLVLRLCELVDSISQQLPSRTYSSATRLSAHIGWYGYRVRLHGFYCQLGMELTRWSKHGISPLWLRIASSDESFPEILRLPLRGAVPEPSFIQENTGNWKGFWLPLRLAEGHDRDSVIRDVFRQLDRIAAAVHMYADINAPTEITSALEERDETDLLLDARV